MVTYKNPIVYAAIADPIRRAILDRLRLGERTAGDLAAEFPISRPAVSRHLRVLRRAGLASERRVAQSRIYSLIPGPLREVDQWVRRYRQSKRRYLESSRGAEESGGEIP